METYPNPKYDWAKFAHLTPDQIDAKAHEIIAEMTLEEKLKQMVGANTPKEGFRSIRKNGGINYSIPYAGSFNARLGIPPILFSDGPRGVVMNKPGIRNPTCFPCSTARAATFDPELEERIGSAIGTELRVFGANFYGGVCINQLYHPRGGRAQESYGEDTFLLGEMGSALLRGVQKHRIMACIKHYAVNNQENMRLSVDVTVDERTLQEVFLPHFHKCVDAGGMAIMASYNLINGIHGGHHPHLLRDILKESWKFPGYVMSDFIFCVRNGKDAILGGLDVEMPWEWRMKVPKMIKLVENGEIPQELVDDAVLRILRQKLKVAHTPEDNQKYPPELSSCPAHYQLALEAARKGIVLLENHDNFLPLKRSTITKMGVIGKYAQEAVIGDHGSSRVIPASAVSVYEGLRKIAGEKIEIIAHSGSDLKTVANFAKTCDVVMVYAGYDYKDEGESLIFAGGDRKSLTLKPQDIKLIEQVVAVNPKTFVVLHASASVITEGWREKVKAILMHWYGGVEGGTALAEIVFGDVNPSGKTPCTFPISEKQLPPFYPNAKETTYGYYHGYRFIDKYGHIPRYPFGYGLSYTTFTYSDLKLEKDRVSVTDNIAASIEVKNTGTIPGDEIIQLYIGAQQSKVERHVKELKAFRRMTVKPREKIKVKFSIPAKELAYFDVSTRSWVVEPTEYKIFIGGSSRSEDLLVKTFQIQ